MRLKNLIFCIFALSALSTKATDVVFDIHAGASIVNTTNNYITPTFERPLTNQPGDITLYTCVGFVGGVGVDINNIVGGFGISSGIDIMRRSMRVDWNNMYFEGMPYGEDNSKFIFWSIPLCINYNFKFPEIEHIFVPMIYTGPVASIKLQQRSFVKAPSWVFDWKVGANFTFFSHYKLGLSYNIPLTETLTFDSKYTKNIKNKLHYWLITLGYQF
ncbi:MAG: hypothetical protein PHR45_08810 [Muribaculaceae bacterium]|nr:hypothetical protein [Muribaculaceae bacterium]